MIRKNATSLILTAILALAMLVGLPIANAANHASTIPAGQSSIILSDDVPTPTPTPIGQSDSGVSGGGNGGG